MTHDPPKPQSTDSDEACFRMYAAEEAKDHRLTALALGVSVLAHVGLYEIAPDWLKPTDDMILIEARREPQAQATDLKR